MRFVAQIHRRHPQAGRGHIWHVRASDGEPHAAQARIRSRQGFHGHDGGLRHPLARPVQAGRALVVGPTGEDAAGPVEPVRVEQVEQRGLVVGGDAQPGGVLAVGARPGAACSAARVVPVPSAQAGGERLVAAYDCAAPVDPFRARP
ncbi:GNAT family N-acetyltransferase [Nonomuraea turkmeniaca]|uniref:GNAT family N-acetyltransferase n=1 Tax=Nonomuraea turkmeniaca TaxID=103838 RepID=UPI003CCC47FF